MASVSRRGARVDVWPGYVDALSALLMVVIFVLLIFTLAQFLLRQLVSDQEIELSVLQQRLAELTEELGLTQERGSLLADQVSGLTQTVASLTGERDRLIEQGQAQGSRLADAAAQVALLNRQLVTLREQLAIIGEALGRAEQDKEAKNVEIEDLGRRLNIELARRLHSLEGYRSEFFGKVKEALGANPDIRVEGDRFVFQSELLFASGSAELGPAGKTQLARLASTLAALEGQIPPDVDWILRIDGHTDRVPLIRDGAYASNWDLSTARALSVVQFLAAQGIPARRMAAAGFGESRPADPGATPEALRRNRRIEIKLTSP